jgi:hypothetical protein
MYLGKAGKNFFFEKKKQKTFANWSVLERPAQYQGSKVF